MVTTTKISRKTQEKLKRNSRENVTFFSFMDKGRDVKKRKKT